MTALEWLERWRDEGAITAEQYGRLRAITQKDRFSVFFELNGLLYAGVLSLVFGVGWTIQQYAASFGDAAILGALTSAIAIAFWYCFRRAAPFSPVQVESPGLALDYVLYLACLLVGTELSYIETRFHWMKENWDLYLLFCAALFFVLAYRFDNRFVLSLALSTLAGWFGVKISGLDWLTHGSSLRPYSLLYSALVAGGGTLLSSRGIKKHFTETYYHVAALVSFTALTSGVTQTGGSWGYLLGLCIFGVFVIIKAIQHRNFPFLAYATLYVYVGISAQLLNGVSLDTTFALGYIIVSGSLVIGALAVAARRFAREE
jgi:hypothetical protein